MGALIHDLKYGVRMLLEARALTLVAVLTIAIGVGLTTHTFSVVYGAMLRGLDLDRGTTLVQLAEENVSEGVSGNQVPLLDLLDWREQQTSFRGIAGYTQGTVNVADEGSPPERYDGAFVTANLFEQVDGVPILGRVFNSEEDAGLGEEARLAGASDASAPRWSWARIALSCALLVAAGMMVKSVINLQRLDLGIEGDRVFTARLGLFDADYPDDEARQRFFDVLVEGVRADPEVEAAALTTNLPANGAGTFRVGIEGVTYADDRDRPQTYVTNVSEGYFEVLGVPVLQGREIEPQDFEGAVDVAVVNESFARAHFGQESSLGRRIQLGADDAWLSIVGVVGDVYVGANGPVGTSDRSEQVFRPIAQVENQRFVTVVARTRGDPAAFVASAQAIVASIDPTLPLYWMRTMEESVEAATFIFGLFGSLFTIFGVAALFLAGVGLYGVMAFSVSRRTQEMGVRMAMGAEPRNVLALVLAQGMRQLAIGGAIGLALGAALVQPMAVVFFDVRPSDPTVYAAIVVTMGVSGLLACIIPARRATRVSPVRALTGS